MRVLVTGASGNVGTSVVRALQADAQIDAIVGLARRLPDAPDGAVDWRRWDAARDPLAPHLEGCDAVIHLAWMIQPSRDLELARKVNVEGSRRVFKACAEAGVEKLVYASSVGAYSPGPKDAAVDESHPTGGIESSFYSRHKADVEKILDDFERDNPAVKVVRLRPALIFKREAATEIRRLFLGPLFPNRLLPERFPVIPKIKRLRFQAVHSDDVGQAYLEAVKGAVSGAFNIAADPVLDPPALAALLGGREIPVPARPLRALAGLTWRARLQPTPPGWLDMALQTPLMDTTRARRELGWEPKYDSRETLRELLDGLRHGADDVTPPLAAASSGVFRTRELLTGLGARSF